MNLKDEHKYLVSVRLMTYNHGAFIADALQGIDEQKTDFDFEVVVGDDFSTDDTISKIKNYKYTNPKLHLKILKRVKGDKYYKTRKKKGRLYNFLDILNNCRGKYIALLDGDDYWTDPLKLTKQIKFLEKNNDVTFCSSFYYQQKNGNLYPVTLPYNQMTLDKIFNKNIFSTASLLFRSEIMKTLPPSQFVKMLAGDWALQAFACRIGKGHAISEYTSVYRIHEGGVWSHLSRSEMGEHGIQVLKQFQKVFNKPHEIKLIKMAIKKRKKEFGLKEKRSLYKKSKRAISNFLKRKME